MINKPTNVFIDSAKLSLSKKQRKKTLPRLLEFLNTNESRFSQVLLGQVQPGIEEQPWKSKDVRHIESVLLKSCKDVQTVCDFLRVLRKAAQFWSVRERRTVALPRIPVKPFRLNNPFSGNLAASFKQYDAWKDLLQQWTKTFKQNGGLQSDETNAQLLNALIVSAVVYGGLLSPQAIAALVRAIPEKKQGTIIADGRVHIELLLGSHGNQNAELRRWQPDSLTATLWMRVPESSVAALLESELKGEKLVPPTDARIVQRYARQLRNTLRPLKNQQTRTLRSLQQCCLSVATTQIPPILVWYANRNVVSHSLTRNVFQQITKDTIAFNSISDFPANGNEPAIKSKLEDVPLAETEEPAWLVPLQSAFDGNTRSSVRGFLQTLAKDESNNGFIQRMADFGDSLLASTGRSHKRKSLNTAHHIVLLIARHTGGYFNTDDPATYESGVLDSVYLQAIEGAAAYSTNPALKRDLVRAFLEFDLYLSARCGKDPIDEDEMPWSVHDLGNVDAGIITFEQYADILAQINSAWPSTEAQERRSIACLLVILGFRCGLRRREALYLKIRDLYLNGVCEILIRPSKKRRLKSSNAKRRLPIGALLTECELLELRAWYEIRKQQGAQLDDCVFGNARENMETVPPSIFTQINKIITTVTGISDAHFHQFRHAFASWLFLSLMLSDLDPAPNLFPHLPKTTAWLAHGYALRKQLYLNAQHTRRHAYLVAQLLGHGSPDTSMENYVHLLDWLLAIYLRRSPRMNPQDENVRDASGISRSTLQRWEQNRGVVNIPIQLARRELRITHRVLQQVSEPNPNLEEKRVENSSIQTQIDAAWQYLYEVQTSGRPEEEIQKRHNLEKEEADGMMARAQYLCGLTFARGGQRHRMETWLPDARNSLNERVLSCPRKPVHESKKINSTLLNSVMEYATLNSQLFARAINIYVHRVQDDAFVRFDNLQDESAAKTYYDFLTAIGILKQNILLVSGDRAERSHYRTQWHELLLSSRSPITKPSSKAYFGPKSALSMRPSFRYSTGDTDGDSGLRFMLVMLFILFGKMSAQ